MEKAHDEMLDPEMPHTPLTTKRDLLLKKLKSIFKLSVVSNNPPVSLSTGSANKVLK
jgi:hypothetical protein